VGYGKQFHPTAKRKRGGKGTSPTRLEAKSKDQSFDPWRKVKGGKKSLSAFEKGGEKRGNALCGRNRQQGEGKKKKKKVLRP